MKRFEEEPKDTRKNEETIGTIQWTLETRIPYLMFEKVGTELRLKDHLLSNGSLNKILEYDRDMIEHAARIFFLKGVTKPEDRLLAESKIKLLLAAKDERTEKDKR